MANFILAYKCETAPTPERMDAFLTMRADNCVQIIPNVWWVNFGGTASELRNWMQRILNADDLLVVIEAKNAAWTGILVDSDIFAHAWDQAA